MGFIKSLYRMIIKDINRHLIFLIHRMQFFGRKSELCSRSTLQYNLFKFLVNYYRNKIYYKYHCDIHPLCILGNNLSFRHPIGIVIGSGTEIKDNVTILQHVTLGGG